MPSLSGAALRLAPELLGRLPERALDGLGRTAGDLARSPLGLRRGVAERQIAASFPGHRRAWVEAVARAAYRHFGRELLTTLALARRGPGAVLERLENPRLLRRAFGELGSRRGGFVVVTGHIGNWELLGACGAVAGRPVLAVARSQGPALDAELGALRRALGVGMVLEGAAASLPAALEAGTAVGLVADQHAGSGGIRVPFLGRPASTHLGPARLALLCDVPLFFGALLRNGLGYRLVLEEVPRPPGRGTAADFTRRWVGRLERLVRIRPDQYLWFHRRWKPGGRPGNAIPGGEVGDRQPASTDRGREMPGSGRRRSAR